MTMNCQVLLVWALQSGADKLSYFTETLERLVTARGQSRSAKSVEVFGWLILLEGGSVLLFPHFVAEILNLPPLVEQAANYFRLAGQSKPLPPAVIPRWHPGLSPRRRRAAMNQRPT